MTPLEIQANDLLRSAYAVAARQGENTNWEAFRNRLRVVLCDQAGADPDIEQQALRATCTPKTFRTMDES